MRAAQLVIFILVIIVNFGVQLIADSPFSDDPEVLIQPAGWAFAIWGPIFIGMIIYSVYMISPKRIESSELNSVTKAGILAGLASIAFVPISYTDSQWLNLLNILWHLSALIWLFSSLKKYLKLEKDTNAKYYIIPTQMYLGWICAATAVSVALFLRQALGVQLEFTTEVYITTALVAVLAVLGFIMITRSGIVVAFAIAWALFGLAIKQSDIWQISVSAAVISAALIITGIGRIAQGKSVTF